MKRLMRHLLLLAALMLAAVPAWSADWEQVGTAGFSIAWADYTGLAIDSGDTPYVAYSTMFDQYKASVISFNGTSWEQVGAAGFSPSDAYGIQLAIDSSGTPYVAYRDAANGGKASVMRFNGTSWEQVGMAGFSPGYAYGIQLSLDSSGRPYTAFSSWDNANTGYKVSVMKFNGTGWEQVGSTSFSPISTDGIHLALDSNGKPYVASEVAVHPPAAVMRFNDTSWEQVGAASFLRPVNTI